MDSINFSDEIKKIRNVEIMLKKLYQLNIAPKKYINAAYVRWIFTINWHHPNNFEFNLSQLAPYIKEELSQQFEVPKIISYDVPNNYNIKTYSQNNVVQLHECINKRTINLSEFQFKNCTQLFNYVNSELFLPYLFLIALRYDVLGGINQHLSIHRSMIEKLNIDIELFGSPLNTIRPYCSAFPDLEKHFGSMGSFSTFTFITSTIYLANPPFDNNIMLWTVERIIKALQTVSDIVIYLILPVWDPKSQIILGQQPHDPFPAYDYLLQYPSFIKQSLLLPKWKMYYHNYFTGEKIHAVSTHFIALSNTETSPTNLNTLF